MKKECFIRVVCGNAGRGMDIKNLTNPIFVQEKFSIDATRKHIVPSSSPFLPVPDFINCLVFASTLTTHDVKHWAKA